MSIGFLALQLPYQLVKTIHHLQSFVYIEFARCWNLRLFAFAASFPDYTWFRSEKTAVFLSLWDELTGTLAKNPRIVLSISESDR